MKKLNNSFLVFFCILLIIGYISFKTIDKVLKEHEKKLIYAVRSKVLYNAKRCYLEDVCKGEVNLEFLYNEDYLNQIVNPVTKEVEDPKTRITFIDNRVNIYWND